MQKRVNRKFTYGGQGTPTVPKKLSTKAYKCEECGRERIPEAVHPYKKSIKFCTFKCARDWLRLRPAIPKGGVS